MVCVWVEEERDGLSRMGHAALQREVNCRVCPGICEMDARGMDPPPTCANHTSSSHFQEIQGSRTVRGETPQTSRPPRDFAGLQRVGGVHILVNLTRHLLQS